MVGFALFRSPEPPPVPESVASALANPPKPVERPIAIMFGDSYFHGWAGVTEQQAIGQRTADRLGYDAYLRGAPASGFITKRADHFGEPMGSYLDQLAADPIVTERPASLVVLEGGLGDRGSDLAALDSGVRKFVAQFKKQQPKAKIVIVGPANVHPEEKSEATAVDAQLAETAGAIKVPYVSVSDLMSHKELLASLSEDKVHPTLKGSEELSKRLAAKLRELGVPDART